MSLANERIQDKINNDNEDERIHREEDLKL